MWFFFSLLFPDLCLVLASHNGYGWERWDRRALSSMSNSLQQGKDCWNNCKLWKVIDNQCCVDHLMILNVYLQVYWPDPFYVWNRLVSEMNGEKKPKSSKGKNQSSEGRKQLANMRVIQRNLVYVVGLPMNLADEYVGALPALILLSIRCTPVTSLITWFLCCSFFSAESILVSMERHWRCLSPGQLRVLYNNLQIVHAACEFKVTLVVSYLL